MLRFFCDKLLVNKVLLAYFCRNRISIINHSKYRFKKSETKMDVILNLNHVPSRILMWGNTFCSNGSDVIVFICGNPGIVDFYREFASFLHSFTTKPVCVIGHAGHDEASLGGNNVLNGLRNKKHLFSLLGQVDHKLDFLNNYIDKRSKLHVIGHSVGAWMILELLQKDSSLISRISSIHLLFPLLQRMAETKNAKDYLSNGFSFRHIMYGIIGILPKWLQRIIIWFYVKTNGMPSHLNEILLKYAHTDCVNQILNLGADELDVVTSLNIEMLHKIKHVTNVIYGKSDGWVPLEFMEDLKQFEPSLQLTEIDCEHAFVLKSSEKIAKMVSDFICKKISKKSDY